MEYLKTKKQRRIVVPKKKPGRKPKKKLYFGPEVQDAIVRYNGSENNSKRNKIYSEEIHKAFDKLCENIINTFKFSYFDYGFEDIKCETVSFLVMNMHKYDHTKGSKAFSYFSVVAKNYLILHNNANYKKLKSHDNLEVLDFAVNINKPAFKNEPNDKNHFKEFIEDLIKYFEWNIPKIFKKKRDIDIAFAVVELLCKIDEIENFNKKSLYILIREMTNVNTSHITKVMNVFRGHYTKIINEFESKGILEVGNKNNVRFF